MAATGKTPILLYGSTTSTNAPAAGNLTNSSDGCEIAINVADKNLFFKDSSNNVNTVPIRQSSSSSNGWLSSTDWTTFNNKQAAGSYALTTGTLAQFASTTSSQLAGVISDETGTGSLVFANTPTLTTPVINGFTGDTSVVNIGTAQFYKDTAGNIGFGSSTFPGQLNKEFVINSGAGQYNGLIFQNNSTGTGRKGTALYISNADFILQNWSNGIISFSNQSYGEIARFFASGGMSIGNTTDPGAANLSVNGKSETNQITTQRVFKSSIAAGGTAVVTINPVNTISSHSQVSIMLNVAYTGSTNLQYHAGYVQLTCNSGTGGGGAAIAEYYNGTVGNFVVATSNFVVTRPGSGQIVITYTNGNGGGAANNVEFAITGLFASATIA